MVRCIETPRCKDPNGYGRRSIRTSAGWRTVLEHRYQWEQVNGPIPKGMVIMHLCNNPACINIDHLKLGTQSENLAQMRSEGRQRVVAAERNKAKTDCKRGHTLSGDNLYINPSGNRECKTCRREAVARSYHRRRVTLD